MIQGEFLYYLSVLFLDRNKYSPCFVSDLKLKNNNKKVLVRVLESSPAWKGHGQLDCNSVWKN